MLLGSCVARLIRSRLTLGSQSPRRARLPVSVRSTAPSLRAEGGITGQNPASSAEAAQVLLKVLKH
jgi:hypothetical protein